VLGIIVGRIVVLSVGRDGVFAGLTTGSPRVLNILLLSISFLVTGGILLFVKTEDVWLVSHAIMAAGERDLG
jgi:hypothetical protein